MTASEWFTALKLLMLAQGGALALGFIFYLVCRGHEKERRLREEGPNHPTPSKYS